jgi:hypothetical protein
MWCKSTIKKDNKKNYVSLIELNWVHLSLDFVEKVLSGTTHGWVCPLV